MDYELMQQMWQAITVIEAQNLLGQLTVSDYPHLAKESRSNVHRDIYKLAHPSLFEEEKKPVSILEAAKMFGRVVNG